MYFWKKLFGKNSARKPDPMEEEIRRLDAIGAITPQPQKEAYWRTLHPLVQAYWVNWINWKYEKDISISASDASSVFYRWGYPTGLSTMGITARQEELMRQYDSCKEQLWQQVGEAKQRFQQMESETAREREQAWEIYWEHYQTLPPQLQYLVNWELAKRGASWGRSGFHGDMGNTEIIFPFSMCGWATYEDPEWHFGRAWGVAFRVTKACFGDRKPLLYYLGPCEEQKIEIIRRYSSGLSNVRVEQRRCRNWDGEEGQWPVVLFELDPAAVKETVHLNDNAVPTKEVGEYIFVLPQAGEFNCLLGEVRDGEMIPLHEDDFCMK